MVYISQKGGGLSNGVSFYLRTTGFRIGSNTVPDVIAEFGILCAALSMLECSKVLHQSQDEIKF